MMYVMMRAGLIVKREIGASSYFVKCYGIGVYGNKLAAQAPHQTPLQHATQSNTITKETLEAPVQVTKTNGEGSQTCPLRTVHGHCPGKNQWNGVAGGQAGAAVIDDVKRRKADVHALRKKSHTTGAEWHSFTVPCVAVATPSTSRVRSTMAPVLSTATSGATSCMHRVAYARRAGCVKPTSTSSWLW